MGAGDKHDWQDYQVEGLRLATDASDVEQASAEEFALIEDVEGKMPGAKVVLREHLVYYDEHRDEDDPEVRRRSLHVSVTVGEFTSSREYAVPQPG